MTLRRWEVTRLHSVESLLWKRLWTCHETDCGMNEWQNDNENLNTWKGWFHSLRSLRGTSVAACLLRLRVQIPQGAWMFVSCECCVLSGRGLCDELITRPDESYWLWCIALCNLETSRIRQPWLMLDHNAIKKNTWKRCARKWSCPVLKYFPQIWLREQTKTMTAGLQAEIHFQDSPDLTKNINL